MPQAAWLAVVCVVGLDYFSTLGYQPSLAMEAAGPLAPWATLVVILATVAGALPVYWKVAGRSPDGRGSLAMLEQQLFGWVGKTVVLVLLGFAVTDFIFTKTLSVAAAAVHLAGNPYPPWQSFLDQIFSTGESARAALPSGWHLYLVDLWNRQTVVALVLLIAGFGFWSIFRHGFTRRVIHLAVAVVVLYLALTGWIILSSLLYVARHPELVHRWLEHVREYSQAGGGSLAWTLLYTAGMSLVFLPQLVLGMSGFEMSMVVMPLVRGGEGAGGSRVDNTRKLLVAAALVMSVFLLGATFVVAVLIPQGTLAAGQPANNRALAYLAHGGALASGQTSPRSSRLRSRKAGS